MIAVQDLDSLICFLFVCFPFLPFPFIFVLTLPFYPPMKVKNLKGKQLAIHSLVTQPHVPMINGT